MTVLTCPVSLRTLSDEVKNNTPWGRLFAIYYAQRKLQAAARAWHAYYRRDLASMQRVKAEFRETGIYEIPESDKFYQFCEAANFSMACMDYNFFPWNAWDSSDEFIAAVFKACRYKYLDENQVTTIVALHQCMIACNEGVMPDNAGNMFVQHAMNNPHPGMEYRQTHGVEDVNPARLHNYAYFTMDMSHWHMMILFFCALNYGAHDIISTVLSEAIAAYIVTHLITDELINMEELVASLSAKDNIERRANIVRVKKLLYEIINEKYDRNLETSMLPYRLIDAEVAILGTFGSISEGMNAFRTDFESMDFFCKMIMMNNHSPVLICRSPNSDPCNPYAPLLSYVVYEHDALNELLSSIYFGQYVHLKPGVGQLSAALMGALYAPHATDYTASLRTLMLGPEDAAEQVGANPAFSKRYCELVYPGIIARLEPHDYRCYAFFLYLHDIFHTSRASIMLRHTYKMNQCLMKLHAEKDGLRYSLHLGHGEYGIFDQDSDYGLDIEGIDVLHCSGTGAELYQVTRNAYRTEDYKRYMAEFMRRNGMFKLWQIFGFDLHKIQCDNYLLWHHMVKNPDDWCAFLFGNTDPLEFFVDIDENTHELIANFRHGYTAMAEYLRINPEATATEVYLWDQLKACGVGEELLNERLPGYDFSRCFIWQPNRGLAFKREFREYIKAEYNIRDIFLSELIQHNPHDIAAQVIMDVMFGAEKPFHYISSIIL